MPDLLAWLLSWLPAGVLATVVLSASSVLLGFGLPLAAGLTVLGLVRGFVELRWREFVLGMLLVVALVAAGVFLRVWGAGVVAGAELGAELGAANSTAAFVFTAVTPFGVILGVVLVVVGLVRRYVGRGSRSSR